MTQISQTTIKRFRKAFPEFSYFSDVEVTAYCRNMKRDKRKVDKAIERKIKSYK